MLRGLLGLIVLGFVVIGRIGAQEVIVARETKPEVAKPPAPQLEQTPSSPEQTTAESPTETPKKTKSRGKKPSSKSPTLDEMRMGGARAAERLNSPATSVAGKPAEAESETSRTGASVASPTATPAKKETREQKSASHRAAPGDSKPDSVGAIRPTMMESGRQEPSGTPLPKWQASGEQTPAP
jgi:cytoskeletal protein RodZ